MFKQAKTLLDDAAQYCSDMCESLDLHEMLNDLVSQFGIDEDQALCLVIRYYY